MKTPRLITITSYIDPWQSNCKPEPTDLIEQAKVLFLAGYIRASGCISRQAIEMILKRLCEASDIEIRRPAGQYVGCRQLLSLVAPMLTVHPDFMAQIEAGIDTGNLSSHGQEIVAGKIEGMIGTAMTLHRMLKTKERKSTPSLTRFVNDRQPDAVSQIAGVVVVGTIGTLSEAA
jgi:hypothetical protein